MRVSRQEPQPITVPIPRRRCCVSHPQNERPDRRHHQQRQHPAEPHRPARHQARWLNTSRQPNARRQHSRTSRKLAAPHRSNRCCPLHPIKTSDQRHRTTMCRLLPHGQQPTNSHPKPPDCTTTGHTPVFSSAMTNTHNGTPTANTHTAEVSHRNHHNNTRTQKINSALLSFRGARPAQRIAAQAIGGFVRRAATTAQQSPGWTPR
ncbi:hypothetical protein E3G70_000808 [Mycobacteroides abscessus]|nr:hypothetical protein E3G70_000808 [Mycobacteroides abscessus]